MIIIPTLRRGIMIRWLDQSHIGSLWQGWHSNLTVLLQSPRHWCTPLSPLQLVHLQRHPCEIRSCFHRHVLWQWPQLFHTVIGILTMQSLYHSRSFTQLLEFSHHYWNAYNAVLDHSWGTFTSTVFCCSYLGCSSFSLSLWLSMSIPY